MASSGGKRLTEHGHSRVSGRQHIARACCNGKWGYEPSAHLGAARRSFQSDSRISLQHKHHPAPALGGSYDGAGKSAGATKLKCRPEDPRRAATIPSLTGILTSRRMSQLVPLWGVSFASPPAG